MPVYPGALLFARSGTIPRGIANRLRRRPLLRVADYYGQVVSGHPTAPSTVFPDPKTGPRTANTSSFQVAPITTVSVGHAWSWFRRSHQVQGQLLGAGRPANRAPIQLICSLTDSPITALALRPGYLIKSTRSFCLHSRATTVSVRADGASESASPLINSNGPRTGFRPGVFLPKNSLTYGLFSQPGFNISLAASSCPRLASQAWAMCRYSGIDLSASISST